MMRFVAKCATNYRLQLSIKRSLGHYQTSTIATNFPKTHVLKVFYDESELQNEEILNEHEQFDLLIRKHLPSVDIKDPVMAKIIECNNVENFLAISQEASHSKDSIVQLLLRYRKVRNKHEPTIMKNINEFLNQIQIQIDVMDPVELTICLLHLRLLSVDMKSEIPQKMIEKVYNHMKANGAEMSTMALVLFSETLMLERSLYSKLIMTETLPIVFEKLKKCDNTNELYLVACILNNVHPVLSIEALEKTKAIFETFLARGIITQDDPKVILKLLNYLNFPYWSALNSHVIQKLLLVLQKSIPKMTSKELIQTNRALFAQYEPAALIPLLRDRANELLAKTKDVELLQIVCSLCTPDERTKYVEMLKDKILAFQTTLGPGSDNLSVFFKILRLLKVSDTELCDCLWTKNVNKIFSLRESDLKHRIPKYFTRYMNFNNNLGGTYRHIEFEKIVNEYCLMEMQTTSSYIPRDFVKFASFVIAYSDQYETIPNFVVEKLIIQQEQFDSSDCRLLSRSLEILHGFRIKNYKSSKVLDDQVEILQFILDNCAKRHIKEANLHVKEVNTILASFVRRRSNRDSQLFYDIMNWYDRPNLELNSRVIREICHSLQSCKFANDSLCDRFFDYIIKSSELVTGETVEKVLTTCYNLSYFPENPEVLERCSEIIQRDFNIMNGLSIVQALIALTFYKEVPFELISKVFQGDFIKKLEQEIQMAYRLETYPQRVMSLVMQLNRAICLDFPEYNIRWFQESFIEAQMSKQPVIRSKFKEDVHQLLLQIVPNHEYLAVNRVTPYGYRIDFEIHIDDYNKFLIPNPDFYKNSSFVPKSNKIAIILLGFDSMINDINRLKGEELLRMRHLEMMNYKVIHVKKSDFSMLYENVRAKIKHLKSLLQILG